MSRMDFQNARDVKLAAADKLRRMGHKLISKCKFEDVVALVELETSQRAGDNAIGLLLRFLENSTPDRVRSIDFAVMNRPALKFNRQMQIAAERAQAQPAIHAMTTNVDEFRKLGGN